MAGNPYSWSLTAASNASADGTVNWAEGQLPGTVNNSARALMAGLASLIKDIGGTVTSGGSANAYTLAINSGESGAAVSLATGLMATFKASFPNTGAATIVVTPNGSSAFASKSLRKYTPAGEAALASGDIQSGGLYQITYDSTANSAAGAWILLNPTIGGLTGPISVTGVGNTNSAYVNGDSLAAAIQLSDLGGAAGNGGQIVFGSGQGIFAGIKASLQNGTGPSGDLIFQTRTISGNVLERLRISSIGDITVNTNKFTVVGSSGNTTVAGTLAVTSDLAVNTNKFTVAATSGNTTVAGTLGVTGAVTHSSTTLFSGAITYGGVTLSNAVTGTGNMVLSASPTFTGTLTAAAISGTTGIFSGAITHSSTTLFSAAITYGGVTLSNAVTGTGNMALSASPTFTGTVTTAALSGTTGAFSGGVSATGAGNTNTNYVNGDAAGAMLTLSDSGGAGNNGGQIVFGSSQGIFAGIKASLQSGTGPAGDLIFQTRTISGNVLERMRVTSVGDITVNTNKFTIVGSSGNTSIAGTLAVTGATTLSAALTYGGVALSNSVTGTGSMALSASPTFTGTVTTPNLTVTSNLTVTGTTIGFYGATALTRQNVGGSRGGGAALQNLLATLSSLGIINDASIA